MFAIYCEGAGRRSWAGVAILDLGMRYTLGFDGATCDANTAKARRLWTLAGLLLADLAGERATLRKFAENARRAAVGAAIPTKRQNYVSDYSQGEELI